MAFRRSFHEAVAAYANAALIGAALLLTLLPLVLVCVISVFADEILTFPPTGLTWRWYTAIGRQGQFLSGFLTSLYVALVATLCGLAVSIPACLAIVRGDFPGRTVVMQFLAAPMLIPSIVLGLASFVSLVEVEIATELPLVGSVFGLAAAHVLITIPWSIRVITANLAGLNRAPEEAAASLGAAPATVFLKVTVPMIWPGIVAAALFSFVVSFGNLELSLFLVRPGQTTLPLVVMQYLQWKVDPTIAAVSVLQIAVVALGLLLTNRFVPLSKVA